MTIDDKKITDRKLQSTLTEKQQKYLHFHQEKWTIMNILQSKKYYLLILEDAKFIYFPLEKALEKTNKRNWKCS